MSGTGGGARAEAPARGPVLRGGRRAAPALDAATVVLVRPQPSGPGFELYMILRPEAMEAYAGYYVFPGGKVAVEDRAPECILACADATAARAPRLIPEEGVAGRALAHWVAGIRELFEEAGVLLCQRLDGEPLNPADRQLALRLADYRERLQRGEVGMADILRAEGWRLRTEALWYLCRWVTPLLNPRRFDAKFFLAILPAGQQVASGGREVDAGMWLSAATTIGGYDRGRIKLRTPTILTLRYLNQFPTFVDLVRHHEDGEPKFHCIPL